MTKIGGKYYKRVKKRKDGSCRPGTVKKTRKGRTGCWKPVNKKGKKGKKRGKRRSRRR